MRAAHAAPFAALGAACLLALGCQSSRGWSVADDSEWREGGPRAAESEPLPPASESAPGLGTIYFAFDAWSIDAAGRERLRANAQAIAGHPDWGRITIEGHCDARGSEEYNLALGMRRAQEAAGMLRDLGVPARRLDTVSFGEARPAVDGHTESAWRWNRRSVFSAAERTAAR